MAASEEVEAEAQVAVAVASEVDVVEAQAAVEVVAEEVVEVHQADVEAAAAALEEVAVVVLAEAVAPQVLKKSLSNHTDTLVYLLLEAKTMICY